MKIEEFELEDFVGTPVTSVDQYLKSMGWENYSCMNDYKWVWRNPKMGISIIAKVEMDEFQWDKTFGTEKVSAIWKVDYLYEEQSSGSFGDLLK